MALLKNKQGLTRILAGSAFALTTACASAGNYRPENIRPQNDSLGDSSVVRRPGKWHWTIENTALALTTTGFLGIDWRQSLDGVSKYPEYTGTNPILGKYPSRSRINQYFGMAAAANLIVQYILPNDVRNIFSTGVIFFQTRNINKNLDAGLSIKF